MPDMHCIRQNKNIAKVKINRNKPTSAKGTIFNKYENKIRTMFKRNAWQPLNLIK